MGLFITDNTKRILRFIRLSFTIFSQLVLTLIPLVMIFLQPSEGKFVKNIILAVVSFALLIFTLVIEGHDKQRAKKERKVAKKIRKIAKIVANMAMLVVLASLWITNKDTSVLLPLILTSITVVFSIFMAILSFFGELLIESAKQDVQQSIGNLTGVFGRVKTWFSGRKKAKGEAIEEPRSPKRARITPVKNKTFKTTHTSKTSLPDVEMKFSEGETVIAPKKTSVFKFPKKKKEGTPTETTSTQDEREEVTLTPLKSKKKLPLPSFLKKKNPSTDVVEEVVAPETEEQPEVTPSPSAPKQKKRLADFLPFKKKAEKKPSEDESTEQSEQTALPKA